MKQGTKDYSNIIIADWAEAINEDPGQYFSSDNVHPNDKGYDKWVDVIYNALPGSVGLLEGNGNDEKVWNGLIELNIQGVSDDAAVLAGIMGNFWVETGGSFNPYTGRSCLGLWQVCSSSGYQDDFVKAVNDAVGGNYWGQDNIPQDIVDAAIRAELNYLKDTGSFKNFVKSKDKVDERTPQAYAELFTVIVENCFETASVPGQPLEDAGVKKIAGYTRYQGLAKRRKYAKEYYDKFAGAGTPTTSSPGNDNNTSGTGVQWTDDGWLKAETLPGAVIEDGRNFANDSAWESPFKTSDQKPNKIVLHSTEGSTTGLAAYNGNPYPPHFTIDPLNKTVHQHFSIQTPSTALKGGDRDGPIQIEIVGICDWYPHDGSCDDPDLSTISSGSYIKRYIYAYSAEAWDYLAVLLAAIAEQTGIPLTGDDFASRTKYTDAEFLSYSGVTSHRRAPLPNNHDDPGNIWPLVQAAIGRNPSASKFANGGSTFDPCPDTSGNNNYSSNGNLIADKAIGLAWPVGHDKDDKNPTDAYRAARQEVRDVISNTTDFTDCSWFATTVIRTSGVDKNVATGSSGILTYMQNHPDLWEEIPNTGDSSVLRPGDVMVVKAGGNIRYGHVKIYVEIDGEPGEAQASKNSHAPLLTKGVDMNASYNRGPYHIFRFKGSQS